MGDHVKIRRDEQGWPFLAIGLSGLLDGMRQDERRELLSYAMLDGEFLRTIASQIAASDSDSAAHIGNQGSDGWLSSDDRARIREAIAPVVGPAVAEEIQKANAARDSAEKAISLLRGLVLVRRLWREEGGEDRREQMDQEWRWADEWYDKENERLGIK